MREVVLPESIIPIIIIKEHCPSSKLLIIYSISSVFSLQFFLLVFNPKCPLAISFIISPSSLSKIWEIIVSKMNCYFVFISVGVNLNSKSTFFVHFPISNISYWCSPFLALYRSIFKFLFMFDPINRPMRSILLRLSIITNKDLIKLRIFSGIYIFQSYSLN